MTRIDRRTLLQSGAAATTLLAAPAYLRAQGAPIKIGILQPVTGALAQDGTYGKLGAEIAIDEINKAGGIKSIGGAKIEMVFGDARSTPEGGTSADSHRRFASQPRKRRHAMICPILSMSVCRTRS
jgi:branched-chain amino acid transport system substrate-binding protein